LWQQQKTDTAAVKLELSNTVTAITIPIPDFYMWDAIPDS